MALMEKLLRNVGVDPEDDDSPPMQRFAQGLAAGQQAMRQPNAAPCSAVIAEFEQGERQTR